MGFLFLLIIGLEAMSDCSQGLILALDLGNIPGSAWGEHKLYQETYWDKQYERQHSNSYYLSSIEIGYLYSFLLSVKIWVKGNLHYIYIAYNINI